MDIETSFPESHIEGVPQAQWFISEHFGKRALIEELVHLIEQNDGPAWSSRNTPKGWVYTPTAIGSFCESRLALLADIDSHTFPPQVRCSERFHVFVDACEETRRAGHTAFGSRLRDPLSLRIRYDAENALVACIRSKTQEPAFREQLHRRELQTAEQEASGLALLDRAFSLKDTLVVFQLDLGYLKGSSSSESLEQLCGDLRAFWRARRQTVEGAIERKQLRADPLVGYILGIAYGAQKGFHAQILVFLDGYRALGSYLHGHELGRLWVEVTQRRGTYSDCSHDVNRHRRRVSGLVGKYDYEQRSWIFEHGIRCLAQEDQCTAIMTPGVQRFETSLLER